MAWLPGIGAALLALAAALVTAGSTRRRGAIGLAALFVGGLSWWGLTAAEDAWVAAHPGPLPDRPLDDAIPGYVTSRSCKACHPSEYATWHASFHRTMTQVPGPETLLPKFDGRAQSTGGATYRFGHDEGGYWIEGGGRHTIALTTGFHHLQAFWYPTQNGRELALAPVAYLREAERWVPFASTFLHPPGAAPAWKSGEWNSICQQCHATAVAPHLPDAGGAPDTQLAEYGIACEACHGPAYQHAESHRDPLRRYSAHLSKGDDAGEESEIIQPQKLSPERSAEICGQCHSIGSPLDPASWREKGFRYRPGDELRQTRFVSPGRRPEPGSTEVGAEDAALLDRILKFNPRFLAERFWSDGMVRISGREYHGLIDSPCYRDASDAERKMTCLSCHEMHPHTTGRKNSRTGQTTRSRHRSKWRRGPIATMSSAFSVTKTIVSESLSTLTTERIRPAVAASTATCRTPPTGC